MDVPEGWLKVIRGQRPPSVKWAKAEKKTERKSSAAPQNPRQPPGPSRSPPSKTPMPAQEVGPRVSLDPDQVVRGPVQGGEVGGRDHCSGKERPSGSTVERGVATRAFSGTGSTSGSTHHLDPRVHCTGPEACGGHADRSGESTGGGCESARNTPTRGSTSSRWRGTSRCSAGGVSQSTTVWPGPSCDSGAFCNRVGDVAGMCSRVASGERRFESRIVRRRRPRRKTVQENQDFGNPCARSDVNGPRFIDSAQCDAVRFIGVDDQSGGFRSQGQCISSRVLTGRLLWKCRRLSARYGHRGERIGEAAHPGPSFLNFGRVRIPGSSGSRFAPLTQVDTVEDVPSTLVSTIAPTARVAEHIRLTVHESDTETVPSVAGSGEVTDDDGLSDVNDMEHPSLGEVIAGLEEISASATTRAAMATLDAVDLSEVFSVRARTLKCPPAFLKGAFRSCLRIALQEAECGQAESNEVRWVRAWKLFLLVALLSWTRWHDTEEVAGTIPSFHPRRVVEVASFESRSRPVSSARQ